AERTQRARIVVVLAAGLAVLEQQLVLCRGVPPRLAFHVDVRRRQNTHLGFRRHHARSMIRVALPWRIPSDPPVPWASATSQFFTCTFGCASPRSCRTASITLVM